MGNVSKVRLLQRRKVLFFPPNICFAAEPCSQVWGLFHVVVWFFFWPKAQTSLMILSLSSQTSDSDPEMFNRTEAKIWPCNCVFVQSRAQMTCLSEGQSKTKVFFLPVGKTFGEICVVVVLFFPPINIPSFSFWKVRWERKCKAWRRGRILENWQNRM